MALASGASRRAAATAFTTRSLTETLAAWAALIWRRALGAADTLQAGGQSLSEALSERGIVPDVFFEVSGSAPGLASVLEAASPGATIVPVGIQRGEPGLPLGSWTLREYTIVGTVAHVYRDDIPEAVRLLAERGDWTDVAAEVLPLSEVVDGALQPLLSGAPGQVKTLIDPWTEHRRAAVHGRAQP